MILTAVTLAASAAARCQQSVETPECMWDTRMAAQAAAEVTQLAAAIRKQHAAHSYDWSPPASYQLQYDSLRGEVYVGGVYVRLFLKNPKYAVRDPVKFAEALVERYLQELTAAAAGGDGAAAALDRCLLLSAAAVALLQGHGLLADHVAQLGYSGRLLALLAGRTARIPAAQQQQQKQQQQHQLAAPDELGGSILRLLHQLAASSGASEALAVATGAPLVPTLVTAMAWGHSASILVLETLKRALGLGNRQRDLLVGQAVQAGLPQKLLAMLDWASSRGSSSGGGTAGAADGSAGQQGAAGASQAQEQEQAVERTLAVDVLRLLAEDGAYASQVNAVLGCSPVWAAYRDQRHDMFLPSGATAESGVVALLTAGDTARFALPAPESVQGGAS
jgi:DnaJ family protein C protein 13